MPERAMSPGPLLHVGYHKTGTTWLQNHLFGDDSSGMCLPWSRQEMLDWVVLPKELHFDVDGARGLFEAGIEKAGAAGLLPVISNERLSGNPHTGGYDSKIIADRLVRLFPDARVLVVFREQKSMIVSLYKQYVREGGVAPLATYLTPPRMGRARIPGFDFRFLEYHHLIAYYRERFGPDAVLALPFEWFRADRDAFLARVVEFAGASLPAAVEAPPMNPGRAAATLWLKRLVNLLFVRSTLNPVAPIDWSLRNHTFSDAIEALARRLPAGLRDRSERKLRDTIHAAVADRYRESNRALATLTDHDLSPHHYDL
jgi:hypothetical protein